MAKNNEYRDPSSNDPTVLKEMNRRLVMGLREADQEKHELLDQIKNKEASQKKIQKKTEDLCALIMKKTRGSKDEKPDFSLSLEQKLEIASEDVKKYFSGLKSDIDRTQAAAEGMLKKAEDRTKKIGEQEQEIESLKKELDESSTRTNKAFDDLIRTVKRRAQLGVIPDDDYDSMIASFIRKAQQQYKIKITLSDMTASIFVEKKDGVQGLVQKGLSGSDKFKKEVEAKKIPEADLGPDVKARGVNFYNETRKLAEQMSEEKTKEIVELIKKLPPSQRIVIRAAGESGYSEGTEIKQYAKNIGKGQVTESTISSSLRDLTIQSKGSGISILESKTLSIPSTPNAKIYRLTPEGEYIYRELFQAEPRRPEWTALVAEHSSAEHGYGIKRTAELLEGTKWITGGNYSVEYYTREKYRIKTEGVENSWFIPDIVLTRKDTEKNMTYRMYIEYETGDCTQHDMEVKLNKISRKSARVFFIVPNEPAAQVTAMKVDKWKESAKHSEDFKKNMVKDYFRVYIITFVGLKNSADKKAPDFKQIAEVRRHSLTTRQA